MKRIIQFVLLIVIFVLIYLFYAIYFMDKEEPKITEENLDSIELNQNNNNSIQNLEYEINIDEKNYYKIISTSSEIINEENIELLKMKDVEGIIINENSRILITSDNAIYNIISHKTNFKENVKIKYLDNTISGENLILDFEEKKITISDNIIYDGLNGTLFADKIKIDLVSKNINILMDKPNEEVIVNLKK
tara:strand:+ start:500 stop:1075 length:576 start_codon:yes stop_codon:yes gene_type:complete